MNDDENTARGHRGPMGVRSTAPAGTPYPVPAPAPAVPAPSASQPRTVGGHTARLVMPEEEAIEFDPLASGSSEPPSPLPLGPRSVGPISTTLGGTQRLDVVSPEEAELARKEAEAQAKKPAAIPQTPPAQPAAAVSKPPAEPAGKPGATPAPAKVEAKPGPSAKPSSSGEPGRLALLFAPASVAVGLVFFAMGCMIGFLIEGRLIHFTVAMPVIEAVPGPSGPAAPAGPTHPAASTSSASHPAASVVVPSATPSARPALTAHPPTNRNAGGTKGGLQPIF